MAVAGCFTDVSESSVFIKVAIFSSTLALLSKNCWTRLRARLSGFRLLIGIRDFSLLLNVQTGSGAHPTKRNSFVFKKTLPKDG